MNNDISIFTASTDFETDFPVSMSLNEQFQCTSIGLLDDSIAEGTEELIIDLILVDADLAEQVTVFPSQATITIQDNDDFAGALEHTAHAELYCSPCLLFCSPRNTNWLCPRVSCAVRRQYFFIC